MKTAYIHIGVPNGGEFHVGPFQNRASADLQVQSYPETLRVLCTTSDDHPVVGTVFPPSTPSKVLIAEASCAS